LEPSQDVLPRRSTTDHTGTPDASNSASTNHKLLRRRPTCSICGEVGHTKRSRIHTASSGDPGPGSRVDGGVDGAHRGAVEDDQGARPLTKAERDAAKKRASIARTWTYHGSNNDIELVHASDFEARAFGHRARSHARELRRKFEHEGLMTTSTIVDAFQIVSDVAILEQVRLVNYSFRFHCRSNRPEPVTAAELRLFLAQTLTYSCAPFSKPVMDTILLDKVAEHGEPRESVSLLSRERHREIMRHIACVDPAIYDPRGVNFQDSTNVTRRLHIRARNVLRDSVRIFLTSFSVLTIDDWLSGLRAFDIELKSKGDRKACMWGVVSDMICDLFFRYIVDIRHRERGHNAKASITETLEVTLQQFDQDLARLIFCADRGYVKEYLWRLLAKYEAGFILICDSAFSTTGHPFIGATHKSGPSYPSGGHVPDGPQLGRAIFYATANIDPSDGIENRNTPVYAYAVRTTKTVKTAAKDANGKNVTKDASQVLRFFSHGTGMEEDLTRTYVMTPQRASLVSGAHETLFVPSRATNATLPASLVELEAMLRHRVVVRTCSQRDATWFILRRFHVTGTVGGFIAKRGAARKFLLQRAEQTENRVAPTSGTRGTASGTPATASGTPATASGTPATATGTPATAAGTPATAAGTPGTASGTPDTAPRTPATVAPAAPGTPAAAAAAAPATDIPITTFELGYASSEEEHESDDDDDDDDDDDCDGTGFIGANDSHDIGDIGDNDDLDASNATAKRTDRTVNGGGVGSNDGDALNTDGSHGATDADAQRTETIANNNSSRATAQNGDVDASDKVTVAQHLAHSWFSRERSTPEMKKGTKNEKAVVKALRRQPWVRDLWEVGLVAMKDQPWIAVSADGVATVQRPEKNREDIMTVTVEIKTKIASGPLQSARNVRRRQGTNYFECTVGTQLWFDSVPAEYRGQVMHQAVVFGFEATLFVVASVTGIIYSTLVLVPESARDAYLRSLLIYKDLVAWAHERPRQAPQYLPGEMRDLLHSHVPLWTALMTMQLPLRPMKVIKSGVQAMYSCSKAAVDGATQFLSQMRSSTLRYSWQQRVTWTCFFSVAVNAVLMFRVWTALLDTSREWNGLTAFRNLCSRKRSFPDSILDLAVGLVIRVAAGERQHRQTPTPPPELRIAAPLPYHPPRYRRRQYFNSDEGRQFRLSGQHFYERMPQRKRCIMCNSGCWYRCRQCSTNDFNAALCHSPRRGQTECCFQLFHSQQDLP